MYEGKGHSKYIRNSTCCLSLAEEEKGKLQSGGVENDMKYNITQSTTRQLE